MNQLQPDQVDYANYRMPAEWEPHEATWLAWPHNVETWPAKGQLAAVEEIWIRMIEALCVNEKVRILVNDDVMERRARTATAQIQTGSRNIEFLKIPSNDAWLRDSGPNFILSQNPSATPALIQDFVFNSWGKKYGPWDADDTIPTHAAEFLQLPVIQHQMVLEGGSIDVNGTGSVLTTRQCLLNKNRNPELSQDQIEKNLQKFLGVTNVLWLDDGIVGDDTDGHVDDIARFVEPSVVVTVVENDTSDANHAPLDANLKTLKGMRNEKGEKLTIVPIRMPRRVAGPFGRSPASYANFHIANGVVLVPIYSCPNDRETLAILRDCFPKREIIGIECTPLVGGLGALHCVTQQQPAVSIR